MSNESGFKIENGVLKKYTGPGGDVVIPKGVTSIDSWAFSHCISLTSVVIPNSVMKIGKEAFCECSSLTIHAPVGNYADQYAGENNLPFKAI